MTNRNRSNTIPALILLTFLHPSPLGNDFMSSLSLPPHFDLKTSVQVSASSNPASSSFQIGGKLDFSYGTQQVKTEDAGSRPPRLTKHQQSLKKDKAFRYRRIGRNGVIRKSKHI